MKKINLMKEGFFFSKIFTSYFPMSASVFHFVYTSVINFLKQSKIWFDFDFCLCFNVVYCNVLGQWHVLQGKIT